MTTEPYIRNHKWYGLKVGMVSYALLIGMMIGFFVGRFL